ncbi:hypothetical protein AAG747_17715 [Rapidithrix thailandica]|uniref:Uncharacterized protein n=1 Tax=Rapidithrix thailandica TaxID=413964 RepID=A0AAW9S9S5_9BACT
MKTFSKISIFLLASISSFSAMAQAEYDDLYFSRKDRKAPKIAQIDKVTPSETPTFAYSTPQVEEVEQSNVTQPKFTNPDYTTGGEQVPAPSYTPQYVQENKVGQVADGSYVPRYNTQQNRSLDANALAHAYQRGMWDQAMYHSPYSSWARPSMSFGYSSFYGPSTMMNWGFGNPYWSLGIGLGYGAWNSWHRPYYNMYDPFYDPYSYYPGHYYGRRNTYIIVNNRERQNIRKYSRPTRVKNLNATSGSQRLSANEKVRRYSSRMNSKSYDTQSTYRSNTRSNTYNYRNNSRTNNSYSTRPQPSYNPPSRVSTPSRNYSTPSRSTYSGSRRSGRGN